MRLLLTFLLTCNLCISLTASAQKTREDSLIYIADKMAQHNIYETSFAVGYTGAISTQYQLFQNLLATTTADDLVSLIRTHKHPVVKLYAYQALKRKAADIPADVTRLLNNDSSKVKTLNGCNGQERSVRSLLNVPIFNGLDFQVD